MAKLINGAEKRLQRCQLNADEDVASVTPPADIRRRHSQAAAPHRRDEPAQLLAGRFTVEDTELALAVAGGALLGLGNLLRAEPERDDARAAMRSPKTSCASSV